MIDITSLTEKDKGREVRYTSFGYTEYGKITSWNDTNIFVRYFARVEGHTTTPRYGETSEATNPADLEFTSEVTHV